MKKIKTYHWLSTTTPKQKNHPRRMTGTTTLKERFLKIMGKNDAREVCSLHKEKHKIDGMLGSLDCVHFPWKNCPVALQGDHLDKDGNFSLVMEAVSDYNLYIWFASIGWAGTQNDLNIWGASPLHECILNGYFEEELDFQFNIGEERFFKLFFLTDGIYPDLARFVKTFCEPNTALKKLYAAWQEGVRKDVERSFGVLKKKFAWLRIPCEKWDSSEIIRIVQLCVMLHNAMVLIRVERNQREDDCWYDVQHPTPEEAAQQVEAPANLPTTEERVRAEEILLTEEERLHRERCAAFGIQLEDQDLLERRQYVDSLPLRTRVACQRWADLHDAQDHVRLRTAIINELRRLNDNE